MVCIIALFKPVCPYTTTLVLKLWRQATRQSGLGADRLSQDGEHVL